MFSLLLLLLFLIFSIIAIIRSYFHLHFLLTFFQLLQGFRILSILGTRI